MDVECNGVVVPSLLASSSASTFVLFLDSRFRGVSLSCDYLCPCGLICWILLCLSK